MILPFSLGRCFKINDPENLDEEKFWYEALDDKGKQFLEMRTGPSRTWEGISAAGIGQVLDRQDYLHNEGYSWSNGHYRK